LLLHQDGADAAAEQIALLVKSGDSVAAVDLRGWGETAPGKANPKKPGYFGSDFKESFLSLHLGRPLLGQRVYDLMRVIDFFAATHEHIGIVAVGATGPVALHAAALDRRVESLTLERSLVSWMNVVQNPVSINQLTNVVPGVLRAYDLPDLAAAVAPRSLRIINPVDGQRRPVSQAELESSYASCREMFAAAGAKDKLVLQAEK
jgi:hypothetical protein